MKKKLRAYSQYYPDLQYLTPDVMHHSQIGEDYNLAKLGCVDELYDRLAKYDIDDTSLNQACVSHAIGYFMNQIGPCGVIPFEEAFGNMDKSKSIGFGASKEKIFSRNDPNMTEYMKEYCKVSLEHTCNVIINASQKDEVRVSTKTARLFTSYPPEHTLLATMVLGDFLRQFVENRFCVNGSVSTVGDSTQNGAARVYFMELDKRPFLYCTDTSAQDSSVHPDFIGAVYEAIKSKYDYEVDEQRWFDCVKHNSINKLINVNGDLYLVPRGLGSGDYLTIVINIMWRLYMFMDSYNHPIERIFLDNTIIICGDDFACSSQYGDLNHDSKYAKIEWAGRPVTWKEMDFCSIRFIPNVHHDPVKVRAVLNLRKKRVHQMNPALEMQRLGGLLRVHSTEQVYQEVLDRMNNLVKKYPELNIEFSQLYVSYDDVYSAYNDVIEYHSKVLKSPASLNKMSSKTFKSKNGKQITVNKNNNSNKQRQPRRKNKGKRQRNRGNRRQGFDGVNSRDIPFTSHTGNQNLGNRKMERKRVVFNETLGTVLSSVDFSTTMFSWNPGQAGTFPWLAKEAAQWEKYQFISAKVVFTPQVTEFSPNGVGSLILGFDSDASDNPPSTAVFALDMQPRSFDLPCKSIVLNIPPKIMNTHTDGFYVRKGVQPPNTDIKTYDCGNLFVSTVSQAANGGVLGYLTCYYTVDFMIPILEAPLQTLPNTRLTTYALDQILDYGDQILQFAQTSINALHTPFVGGSITPPQGNYLVMFTCRCFSGNDTEEDLDELNMYCKRDSFFYQAGGSPILFWDSSETESASAGRLGNTGHFTIVTDGTHSFQFGVIVVPNSATIGTQFSIQAQITFLSV